MPKVTSKDGTTIAYDKAGQGLAVILVEGALGSRRASAELAKLLAPAFTVYSYDRRGRGVSTDTKPYSVQKEVEDIEALLDRAGEAACLYGISSGGALALYDAVVLGEDRTVPVSRVSDITAHTLSSWMAARAMDLCLLCERLPRC